MAMHNSMLTDSIEYYEGEGNDNETRLIEITNQLLEHVGIVSKKVASIDELVRVGSSLFVAVMESLFHIRIEGIIRSPRSPQDYTINAQLVVDCLSKQIQMDLKHITGESIVGGDLQSISNLVNILYRIVTLTKSSFNRSKDSEYPDDFIETFITAPKSIDSISTHESAFQFEEETDNDTGFSIEESPYLEGDEFISRTEKLMEIQDRMEKASKRRTKLHRARQKLSALSNQRRADSSKRALQARKKEDLGKQQRSYLLQKSSEEQSMLRKVYSNLLERMHVWKSEDLRETRERIRELDAESLIQRQSLDSLFQDRINMLKEQEMELSASSDTIIRSHRKMLNDLLGAQRQQHEKTMQERQDLLAHRRQRLAHRRREAHKDLLAALAAESWSDSLRHYSIGVLQKGKSRRPRSAPRAFE